MKWYGLYEVDLRDRNEGDLVLKKERKMIFIL